MPSAAAASASHDLIGCLEDIWHFGRPAYFDRHVAVIADVDSPPQHTAAGSHHFLHPLFRLLDEDGDGHVSLDEMRSQQLAGRNACLAALVEAATRSASEEALDFPQFAALYESVLNEVRAAAEEEDEVVEDAFHVYDRNGDGFISASELATVLMEYGLMAATSDGAGHVEKCQALIDRVDSDGNGLVDLQEFKAMLGSNHFTSSSILCEA